MHSKAQGLSLNTMVIAGIVLVVLLVIIALFTGFFSNFTPDFKASLEKSCEGEDYSIKSSCDTSTERQVVGRFKPELPEGQVCCVLTQESKDAAADKAALDACKQECSSVRSGCYNDCNGLPPIFESDCQDGCGIDYNSCVNKC